MSVTILDGGLGQELIRRAGKATPLWSVQALIDEPEIVRAVHDDFFAAGAEIATTNTYSVRPDRMNHHGIGHRLEELQHLACQIAVDARDAHGSGLVLGGMSPLGYSYRPEQAPPSERAAEVFDQLARMQLPYVDGFILETMGSVDEARGALMGTSGHGKPVWLAVTASDADGTKLRSGEEVADIIPLVDEFNVDVVMVNCSRPEAVTQTVPILGRAAVPCGAYANGFTGIADDFDNDDATVDLLTARTDLGPAEYLSHAKDWAEQGATLIGGCCEVGPDHIAALHKHFKEAA
ncbi:MAG: homocysteine S-methyltransferase family protein [Pseudomonadota bacterium]